MGQERAFGLLDDVKWTSWLESSSQILQYEIQVPWSISSFGRPQLYRACCIDARVDILTHGFKLV